MTVTLIEGDIAGEAVASASPLRWFTFNQNNSGGAWAYDADAGIGYVVLVQAVDVDGAVERAEQIGLYFGGEGDCDCCGDRWYLPWSSEASDEPEIYGDPAEEYRSMWAYGDEAHAFLHYYDGTIKGVYVDGLREVA